MDRLGGFLARHRSIGVDTSPFIYHLQDHPRYRAATARLFKQIERGRPVAVTSTVTMVELLVHPFRENDTERVNGIFALLSHYPHLSWIEPSLAIAERAAFLRARHNFRTPDAIHVATAILSGATGLVTNDLALAKVTDLDVLVLDDCSPGARPGER
jgi:predicted nucleic acid-binding protein